MFKDLNNDGEKKSLRDFEDKILKVSKKIDKIATEENGIASVLLMSDKETGFVNVQGNGKLVAKALMAACEDNPQFALIIKKVAATLMEAELEDDDDFKKFKKDIQAKIDKDVQDKGISEFTSDEGEQGFAIDIDKVDEIDDEDIDKIVENMLKNKGIRLGGKSDDKSE